MAPVSVLDSYQAENMKEHEKSKNLKSKGPVTNKTEESTGVKENIEGRNELIRKDEIKNSILNCLNNLTQEQIQKYQDPRALGDLHQFIQDGPRWNAKIVRNGLDAVILSAILAIGMYSDFISKNNKFESFYLKLAIAIILTASNIDHFCQVQAVDTIACAVLSAIQVILTLMSGLNSKDLVLDSDLRQFYVALLIPTFFPRYASLGTAFICWIYVALTLYSANLRVQVVIIVILAVCFRYEEIKNFFKVQFDPKVTKQMYYAGTALLVGVAAIQLLYDGRKSL